MPLPGRRASRRAFPRRAWERVRPSRPCFFSGLPRGRGVGVRGYFSPLTPDRGMTANRFAAPYFLVYGCSWRLHHDRTNTNATDEPAPLAAHEGQKDHQGDHVQGPLGLGQNVALSILDLSRNRCPPAGEGTAGQRAGCANPAGERESPPGAQGLWQGGLVRADRGRQPLRRRGIRAPIPYGDFTQLIIS